MNMSDWATSGKLLRAKLYNDMEPLLFTVLIHHIVMAYSEDPWWILCSIPFSTTMEVISKTSTTD